jgi:hypothetical protein
LKRTTSNCDDGLVEADGACTGGNCAHAGMPAIRNKDKIAGMIVFIVISDSSTGR